MALPLPSIRQVPKIIEFLGDDPERQTRKFAKGLAYARRRLGLTQEDLAEKLEVDPGTILRRGRRDGVEPFVFQGSLIAIMVFNSPFTRTFASLGVREVIR